MWKDWFFFSKSQRLGIFALIFIIIVLLVIRIIMPHFLHPHITKKDHFETQAKQFIDSLKPLSYQSLYKRNTFEYKGGYVPQPWNKKDKSYPISLTQFNPNTADSAQLVRLGIRPYIVSNIIKYRKKGGKFKQAEDIRKIWGLSNEDISRLLPYVSIPAEPINPAVVQPSTIRIQKTNAVVELNSADTTQLQQIKGIGAGYAKRIVAYRKKLGGFVKPEQLREVWGITPELFNTIRPYISVNPALVVQIQVNKASIEKLKYHPYLNFYTAKALFELRLTKKVLRSIQDLKQSDAFTPELLDKIAPYLSFQ